MCTEAGRRTLRCLSVIDARGEVLGVSKMVHIAQAKYFYEQDYYTPSDDGFKVYDTSTISSPTWRRASPPSGDKLPHSQGCLGLCQGAMLGAAPRGVGESDLGAWGCARECYARGRTKVLQGTKKDRKRLFTIVSGPVAWALIGL